MNIQRLRIWSFGLILGGLMSLGPARAQVNLTIGTMQPGQEVVVKYEVTLNASLLPAVTQISSQASISGTGFTSPKATDDPETINADDATVFSLQNDGPVVVAGNTIGYTEQGSAGSIAAALTVTDVDTANLVSATISITSGFVSGDTLSFTGQNGISGSYDSSTGILSLSGSATVAFYQTVLRTVAFSSSSDNPTANGANTSRTISFVANDGIVDSAAANSTINITPINNPPVLSAGNSISYSENDPPTAISPALAAADVDNVNLVGAAVTISAGLVVGDALGFSTQNGISGSYSTGTLTLTGSSTVANYRTALRSVTFSSTSDEPAAGGANPTRTISFVANDGTDSSTAVTATINVSAVNDDPIGGTHTIKRAPNDDVKVQVSTLLAADSDPDGGTLSITGVTTPSAGGATVTLSGGWIYYTHAGTTSDSFTYTLTDGQGGSSLVTVSVVIQGVDTQAGPALTPSVDSGGAHVTFNGIPGLTYTMQSSANANGPWSDAGAATEDATGHYTFTDNAVLPANFYRSVYRP